MKNIIKISICILIFSFIIGCKSNNLTNEQVIQIVKNFENNQNLTNLTVKYNDKDNIYDVNNHNSSINWEVSPIINKVIFYINFSEIADYNENENGVFTKAQCENIALTYLNNKGISLIGFEATPIIDWDDEGGYCFFYYKLLNSNIELMSNNNISITVNANSGKVNYFHINTDPDPVINNYPTLTDAELTGIINQVYGSNNISSIIICGYTYEKDYKTIIRAASYDDVFLYIDAYTHKILDTAYPLDGKNHKNISKDIKRYNVSNKGKKKVVIKTKPYKPLSDEDLAKLNPTIKQIQKILVKSESKKDTKYFDIDCTKTPPVMPSNIKLSSQKEPSEYNYYYAKADKNIVYLNIKDKKIIFNNGSCFAFVNNKTNNMGGNFIIENNKIKIPQDFAKKIDLIK